ncbi:MAG TPA: hypothetical protein VF407_07605 [Polyangiaceae bacterium]
MNIFQPGNTLACEMGDFDSMDKFFFRVDGAADAVELTWKEAEGEEQTMALSPHALAAATKWVGFGQGTVSRYRDDLAKDRTECGEKCDCHTVPMLLGREAFVALKKGEPITLLYAGTVFEFRLQGTETRTLQVDGEPVEVSCLFAGSEDARFYVVDDERWPVIVELFAMGDQCSSVILGVSSTMSLEEIEQAFPPDAY